MSTVQVALVKVGPMVETRIVPRSVLLDSEVATSSGSSDAFENVVATSTVLGGNVQNGIWRIAVAGSDSIYVAFGIVGALATASSTTGFLCPAGGVYEFACSRDNEVVSIIQV